MNMKHMGILNENENISKMLQVGEPVTYIGGRNNFYITNACPEFFLHEHEHKLFGMGNLATHQFTYDKDYLGSKFRPGESRHYTECPEYSLSSFKKPATKIRKKISPKIKAELQKEISSKCPFCPNEDVGHFQIHHIDQNPENNDIGNLLMLCANCHSKVTKEDTSEAEVIAMKNSVSKENEKPKYHDKALTLDQKLFDRIRYEDGTSELFLEIRSNGFSGRPVLFKRINTLLTLIEESRKPEFYFFNSDLNNLKDRLVKTLIILEDLTSQYLFGTERDGWLSIPSEWEYRQPEMMHEAQKKIKKQEKKVDLAFATFVKEGRRILIC